MPAPGSESIIQKYIVILVGRKRAGVRERERRRRECEVNVGKGSQVGRLRNRDREEDIENLRRTQWWGSMVVGVENA